MAIRPIITIGHKTLSRKAAPVEEIDDDVRLLARDMVETLHAAPGIGLSAPQVNAGVRLIVVDLSIGENPDELIVMANPEITAQEGACVREEGCLSVPEVFEKVSRPQKITVRGLGLDGREKIIEAQDLLARAFCHEIDHLEGKLFVDRLSPLKRSLIRKKFKKAAAAAS
ncbi:MAG: peptide deformylase [Candidatus Aminicenantes bacterium]|nr:peptide deformylase [Candidatus Aminicenantes bacterium]